MKYIPRGHTEINPVYRLKLRFRINVTLDKSHTDYNKLTYYRETRRDMRMLKVSTYFSLCFVRFKRNCLLQNTWTWAKYYQTKLASNFFHNDIKRRNFSRERKNSNDFADYIAYAAQQLIRDPFFWMEFQTDINTKGLSIQVIATQEWQFITNLVFTILSFSRVKVIEN